MEMTVSLLRDDALEWPLTENNQNVRYNIPAGTYSRSVYVDPFPAYSADP